MLCATTHCERERRPAREPDSEHYSGQTRIKFSSSSSFAVCCLRSACLASTLHPNTLISSMSGPRRGDCLSGCGLGRSGFRTSGVEQHYTPRVVAFGAGRVFGRCVYKHTKRNNRNSVVCAFIPWPPPPPSSQSFYALRHRRQTTDVWGLEWRVSDG